MTGKATKQIIGLGLKMHSKFDGDNFMCEKTQIPVI